MASDWQQDAELLDAWRSGNDGAGERLFDRHADAVARFFENKVREGAEDLTQATFLRMIEGRERVHEGIAFRAFVLGIARNVLREHVRELVRGRQIDPEVDSMVALAPGPSSVLAERDEQRLLLEALRQLPLDQQILLELFYWERLKSHEIAAVLELAPSTIRTRLVKAREQLAAAMAAIAASPELLATTLAGIEGWAAQIRERLSVRPKP